MAVSHGINVTLKGKMGVGSSKSPTNRLKRITSGGSGNNPKTLSEQISTIRESQQFSQGIAKTGITLYALNKMKRGVNKVIDIGLNIELARTGESLSIGNIQRVKNYIMHPRKYVIDASYGKWLRDMEISRANASNEYYRQLTGEIIVGNQYGTKR